MTDVAGVRPLPGWHPDPWMRGRLRWWDGEQWAPTTAPDWVYGGIGPDVIGHIAQAGRWCHHASRAFLAQAIIGTITALCLPVVMGETAEQMRAALESPAHRSPSSRRRPCPPWST